jgi:membrane fusion protein, heavy metal efflux system
MTALRAPISRPLTFAALFVLVAAAACNRSGSTPADSRPDSAAASEMKDMPGMAGKPDADEAKPGAPAASVTFTAAQIQHGGVRWGPVTAGTSSGTATVPGEVRPDEDLTERLGAPAGGRILSVHVQPGDRVASGQALVTMQSPEAGTAQSDLVKAEAALSAQRSEMQYAASARARAERLLTLKAIPRQEYERAMTDDEHARAALAQAEAELRRARATSEQLSAGASASGQIVIRARRAGVVLARTAVPGAVVETGAPLVVVTNPATLWLTVAAPERLSGLFHRGGLLRFTVPAYPAETFTARIDAIGAGLDPDTRTLSVRAVIANAGRLKPEMLATVIVEGVGSVPAFVVPEDAVQLLHGKPNVFLARANGNGGAEFVRREVVLGSRASGRVVVIRGLSAGDVIVTAGAFAVKSEFDKATMPKMEM